MDSLRLIHDSPAPGSWNMALDEALMEWVEAAAQPCLRFYQWTPPTLSLGYFQRYFDRRQHLPSSRLPVIRRSTGGGAIVHDQELTYSLVMPIRRRFSPQAKELVSVVHQALGRALAQWSISVKSCGTSLISHRTQQPFLCFQRRTADDVLLAGHKIAGSAQRQRRHTTLLHGTVLIAASQYASELPGINDLAARPPALDELAEAWTQQLSRSLNIAFQPDQLRSPELERARQLETQRYSAAEWTRKR